jgi:5-methylcytosine-specific restriction endonuclease McrA
MNAGPILYFKVSFRPRTHAGRSGCAVRGRQPFARPFMRRSGRAQREIPSHAHCTETSVSCTTLPNLVARGYCSDHADMARRYDRERANDPIRRLYWSDRWRKYSHWRQRGHPFCALCGGRATLTDHIRPAPEAPEKFWDADNHRSLCHGCNTRAARSRRMGRPRQLLIHGYRLLDSSKSNADCGPDDGTTTLSCTV